LENFWDITSPEEFNDVVRKVFEQDWFLVKIFHRLQKKL
jgi:hypothetical protein